MPQPTNYTPTTDFSQQEANNASGRSTVNTAALDAEFANIETTLDQTLSNLQLIQRDDGRLDDVTVEVRCLAPDVLNVMGGFNLTGLWTPATAYAVNDICSNGEYTYVCKTAHTSGGSFSATNWVQFGFTSGADAAQAAANAQASAAAALVSENNSSGHASSASASASAAASSAASAASSASSATSSASAASSSATSASNSASAAAASAASISFPVPVASGGTGATNATGARSALGLGTAATLNVGTGANNVVQLDGSGALPAVSGVNLTNLPTVAQIQPISASVSANNLTISASALTLDFRSVTLGSGAVTRVSGAPANLIISSGSTLGTVSGQQSDIAVLAINNAGTIELAAVNVAGGVNLDEARVISTAAEGGAGAADSAAVVYSTTARTNVAYRVIGIVRSTQTTAGTWATAPSLIQGMGGNALSSMQSIGYGQTWQTVTRTSGVTYYNTTGKPILILVDATGNAASFASVTISVNGVSFGLVRSQNGTGVSYGVGVAVIPPNAAYVLTDTYIAARTTLELR